MGRRERREKVKKIKLKELKLIIVITYLQSVSQEPNTQFQQNGTDSRGSCHQASGHRALQSREHHPPRILCRRSSQGKWLRSGSQPCASQALPVQLGSLQRQ